LRRAAWQFDPDLQNATLKGIVTGLSMIEIRSETLRAQVLERGATLSGLWCRGYAHSLVLGAPRAADYSGFLDYFGALVGPIANRVASATVQIEGRAWPLDANEGTTCLHSGSKGLHAQDWDITAREAHSVTLGIDLPHRFGGLPGNRRITAEYTLMDSAGLRLTIAAETDATTAINIAHHPYWNLNGASTIGEHSLEVMAVRYLPVNAKTLPTGEIAPVAGSAYDFRTSKRVATDKTLDANLCLAEQRRVHPQKAAVLSAPDGPTLTLCTTEPGLQVYNGSGLAPVPLPLHDGRELQPFAGIALEPQAWPDAPNQPGFPSILLDAGARYTQITEYRISR
jgi:aldose 1-epimerase